MFHKKYKNRDYKHVFEMMILDGTAVNIFKIANIFNLIKCCLVKDLVDLDTITLESAAIFSEKWSTSPKQYVSLVLPDYPPSNVKEVIQLSNIFRKRIKRDVYFLFVSDLKQ